MVDNLVQHTFSDKAHHLSVELEHKTHWEVKTLNFDLKVTGEKRLLELNKLDELRLGGYEYAKISKKRTKVPPDKRIVNGVVMLGAPSIE